MLYGNSFKSEDYLQAMEAFQKWQGKQNETVNEYILRKRKVELGALVKQVIRDELTKEQKILVELHWYNNLSTTQIAERLGLSRSTVFRKLENINNIIYDKLKYAMMYRYGEVFAKDVKLIIKNDDALYCHGEPEDIPKRIVQLRKQQFLTPEQVSEGTGISISRLEMLEKGKSPLTATELKRLSVFYRVSSDYIVFGKNRFYS